MSENKIHYMTLPCGTDYIGGPDAAEDWAKVTCGQCRLEMPMQSVPGRVEYRVPEHVKATDRSLPTLAEARARRLAAVREVEDFALEMVRYYAKQLADATSLRERLEKAQGVGTGTPEVSDAAQSRSDGQAVLAQTFARLSERIPRVEAVNIGGGRRIEERNGPAPAAPVDAVVDMRTDQQYAEGMTNLSDSAKSALINSRGGKQGAEVRIFSYEAQAELKAAGLIGRNDCLTRKGTIARERLVRDAEDRAFG